MYVHIIWPSRFTYNIKEIQQAGKGGVEFLLPYYRCDMWIHIICIYTARWAEFTYRTDGSFPSVSPPANQYTDPRSRSWNKTSGEPTAKGLSREGLPTCHLSCACTRHVSCSHASEVSCREAFWCTTRSSQACEFPRMHVRMCERLCVCNQVFVWARSYNRAGAAKGTLVVPLTRVNLPYLVLKASTWWLCGPGPRTFWAFELAVPLPWLLLNQLNRLALVWRRANTSLGGVEEWIWLFISQSCQAFKYAAPTNLAPR